MFVQWKNADLILLLMSRNVHFLYHLNLELQSLFATLESAEDLQEAGGLGEVLSPIMIETDIQG